MADVFGDADAVEVTPSAGSFWRPSPIRPLSNTTSVLLETDDVSVEATLPFTFWGETSAGVTSNGYISLPYFTSPYDCSGYYGAPLDGHLGSWAPFFKGVFVSYDAFSESSPHPNTSCVYGDVAGGGWGVTWTKWGFNNDWYRGANTFQIVLWPDGSSEINVESIMPATDMGKTWAPSMYVGWRPTTDVGVGSSYTLPGSGDWGDTGESLYTYYDGGPNSLADNSNVGVTGRWVFTPGDLWSGAVSAPQVTAEATGYNPFVRESAPEVVVSPQALASGHIESASDAGPVSLSPATYVLAFKENEDPGTPDDEWSGSDPVTVSPTALAAGQKVSAGMGSTVVSPTTSASLGSVTKPAQGSTAVTAMPMATAFVFFSTITTQNSVRYSGRLSVSMRVPLIMPASHIYAVAAQANVVTNTDSEGTT